MWVDSPTMFISSSPCTEIVMLHKIQIYTKTLQIHCQDTFPARFIHKKCIYIYIYIYIYIHTYISIYTSYLQYQTYLTQVHASRVSTWNWLNMILVEIPSATVHNRDMLTHCTVPLYPNNRWLYSRPPLCLDKELT